MIVNAIINDIDFLEEYGLYLTDRELGQATPNLYQLEVPGRNGKVDYTDFYGDVTYQNRTVKMTFQKKVDEETENLKYTLERKFNGRSAKVIFSDDDDHYWKGRLTITENDCDKEMYQVTFELDAHPFKFRALYDSEVK